MDQMSEMESKAHSAAGDEQRGKREVKVILQEDAARL